METAVCGMWKTILFDSYLSLSKHMRSIFDLDITQILKMWTGNKFVLLEHKSIKIFQSSDLTHVLFTAFASLVGADMAGRAQGKLWPVMRVSNGHRKQITTMTHMETRGPKIPSSRTTTFAE